MRFRVQAPASSANLGPGFDTLALALGSHLVVDIDTNVPTFAPEELPTDLAGGEDLVRSAMNAVAAELRSELPMCAVRTTSAIPVARGLGSSAAAIVAGVTAGNHLLNDQLDLDDLFRIAVQMEGHGDNVAAALFGGAVITILEDHVPRAVPVRIRGELTAVLFVPDRFSLTKVARGSIPDRFSRCDAVFNASRCALLIHALESGDFSLLAEAMRDRIHQPYRASLYPHLKPMIAGALESGAYGASLSGSGPTVLALTGTEHVAAVQERLDEEAMQLDVAGHSIALEIAGEGVVILSV